MMPDGCIHLGPGNAQAKMEGQVSTCINRVRSYYGTPGVSSSSSSSHTQGWKIGTSFPNVSVTGPSVCEPVVMFNVIVAPLIEPKNWAGRGTADGPTSGVKVPLRLKLPIASGTRVCWIRPEKHRPSTITWVSV